MEEQHEQSQEERIAKTAAVLNQFADKLLATDWFPKQFKADVSDKTRRLCAIEFGVNKMAQDSMGFMPMELIHVMTSQVLLDIADQVGSSKEEMRDFLKLDAHDYLSTESLKEKCAICDKKEDCDQYKEMQKEAS